MKLGRIQIGLLLLALGIALSADLAIAKKKENLAAAQMDQRKRAVHALNRLTFGPRPGDVDRVMAMGVDQWIEQQLHPDKIDDSALDARLTPFRTLHMQTREIVENFPSEQMIKAVADGKQSLPSDPLKRAVYQAPWTATKTKKTANSRPPSQVPTRLPKTNTPVASKIAKKLSSKSKNFSTCRPISA